MLNCVLAVGAMTTAGNPAFFNVSWKAFNSQPIEGCKYFAETLNLLPLIAMPENWWAF